MELTSHSVQYIRTNRWLSAARVSLAEMHDAHGADQAALGTLGEDVPSKTSSLHLRRVLRRLFLSVQDRK